jgi:phenylacetic acid degradation operon negative regulatory protein
VTELKDQSRGPTGSAQDLTLTLFGDYLLGQERAVWVGHVIQLLETLAVSPSSARTALSRMAGKGWLQASRRGRFSFYALTAQGRRLLTEGRERIQRPPGRDDWDGRWSVITCTVPEEDREIRDRFRVRLTWLGCGSLGNGVWISPHDVETPLLAIADSLAIREGLHFFRGEFGGPGTDRALVARCWDLDRTARAYQDFTARYTPPLERSLRSLERFGRLCPAEAFLLRFRLIHEYRRFPFVDPGLPRELLPAGWAGYEAADLFRRLHGLLEGPAEEHVGWVLDGGGLPPERPPGLPASHRSAHRSPS